MRDTYLIIHILAAGAWFGTNMVQVVVNPGINKKAPIIAAEWHRTLEGFLKRIYMPAAIIALVTGVLLLTVDNTPYEMSDPFVSLGFLTVIVGSALGMGFFGKQSRAAAAAYDAGDISGAAEIEKKISAAGLLDTFLIALTVVAMVSKWGV